jgi:hypothetical protein
VIVSIIMCVRLINTQLLEPPTSALASKWWVDHRLRLGTSPSQISTVNKLPNALVLHTRAAASIAVN